MPYVHLLVLSSFLLLGLGTGGCAMNPVSGHPEMVLVSNEQEKSIGAEEAKKVEQEMGLLDDDLFAPYLNQLGQRLAAESPRKDVSYQFHLVDMTEPNAFALPGGYVYVTRGLLLLVNSEDELAGVVGHEIGHVAARHSVQQISKKGPFAVIFGVVSGVTGLISPLVGDIVGGIGQFTQSLIFSPYSRSQETEADKVGQEIAARAGWDPAELSAFLATLEREVQLMSKDPRKPSFFDSHPATPDRVEKTAEHAKELKRADRPPISPSREAFLARLDGLVVGQRAANGVFVGNSFQHPDLNFFIQFPEKWEHDNSPQKIVAVAPDKEAGIIIGAVAQGNDPLEGMRLVEKAAKIELASKTERVTINQLSAAHARLDEGRATLDITWIAHGGLVYQVIGLGPTKRFEELLPVFTSVAHSFRPLTTAERGSIKEKRIRLVKARGGETVEALTARSHTAWSKEQVAVANGLEAQTALKEGQVIKVAMTETYEAPKTLK